MNLSMFLGALGSLFAIMNPLVSLPMFLSLTASYSPARHKRSALKVGMYTTIFCAVVLATGSLLLKVFGISVDDFRVAGGLVLAIIGIGMLHGGSTLHDGTASEQAHQTEHATSGDISFYPMTFPMLAGPGTITTLVLLAGHADGAADWVAVGAALLVILVALTVVLFCAGSRISSNAAAGSPRKSAPILSISSIMKTGLREPASRRARTIVPGIAPM